MFDRLRSIFQPKFLNADPYEQFVAAFIEECKRQCRKPESYDPQTRSVVFPVDPAGREERIFLENTFREWLVRDAQARAGLLKRFVGMIGDMESKAGIDPSKLPAELMPGIRSRALISNVLVHNWTLGAPEGNSTEYAWTPFCGELSACIVRDLGNNLAPMAWSNLDVAKLSFEQAMAHAMTQFRAKALVPEFLSNPSAEGLFYSVNLEDHQSALPLMTPGKDFVFPALDGDAVALVPARNLFFVTGHRNQTALKVLLRLAEGVEKQAHFCSPALLIWRDGRWDEFVFEAGTDEAVKQQQITLGWLAFCYNRQKELLDQLHKTRNADIFTATFMVYRKKDQPGLEFSATALGSGTHGTLLPEASRIGFIDQIVDPKTGLAQGVREAVTVSWSNAMDIAGHLFEPVPNLYPPRYRALGFPNGSLWDKLQERAVK